MVSVAAAAFALPRYRLPAEAVKAAFGAAGLRGLESITVAGHDEDEVTLAVEAATSALSGTEETPAHLVFASAGSGAGAATVARALGRDCTLADKARCHDPLAALLAGVDAVLANRAPSLVVWTQAPPAERFLKGGEIEGAGAAALLLSGSGFAAVRIERGGREKAEDADVWKRTGRMECAGLPLALIEAMSRLKEGSEGRVAAGGGAVVHVTATSTPDVSSPARAAATGAVKVDLHHAARLRAALEPEQDAPMGAHVSDQSFEATIGSRYRLEAQRCRKCSHVQLPPRSLCLRCGAGGGEQVSLARAGEVEAVTVVARGASPSEFQHQQAMAGEYAVAIVSLPVDGGPGAARLVVQMTDCDAASVAIGQRVEAVFRRLYVQLGKPRYGLKFRPAG